MENLQKNNPAIKNIEPEKSPLKSPLRIEFEAIAKFIFSNFTDLNNAISFNKEGFSYSINLIEGDNYLFNKFPINNSGIIAKNSYNEDDFRVINLYLKFRLPHLIFKQITDKIENNNIGFAIKKGNVAIAGFDGKQYNHKTSLTHNNQELVQYLSKIENQQTTEYDKVSSCDFMHAINSAELNLISLFIDYKKNNLANNINNEHNQQLQQIYQNINDNNLEENILDNKEINIGSKNLLLTINNKNYKIYNINNEIFTLADEHNIPLNHQDSQEIINQEIDNINKKIGKLKEKIHNNQILSQDEKAFITSLESINIFNIQELKNLQATIITNNIKPLQEKIKTNKLTIEEEKLFINKLEAINNLNPQQGEEIKNEVKKIGDSLINNFTNHLDKQLNIINHHLITIDNIIPDYDIFENLQNSILLLNEKIENQKLLHKESTQQAITELSSIKTDWAKNLKSNLENKSENIIAVDFRQNKAQPSEIKAIISSITSRYSNITQIGLADNNLSIADLNIIIDSISNRYGNLTKICIGKNDFVNNIFDNLVESIINPNNKLTGLCIGSNKIGNQNAIKIANSLRNPHNKITELGIGNNQIDDDGIKAIFNSLKDKNNKIIELHIGNNQINNQETIIEIADGITNINSKLKWLNIKNNNIKEEDIIIISEALRHKNCNIQTIIIDDNYQEICNDAIKSRTKDDLMIEKKSNNFNQIKKDKPISIPEIKSDIDNNKELIGPSPRNIKFSSKQILQKNPEKQDCRIF